MRDRRPERHAVHDANAVASLLHVTDEREVAAAGASSAWATTRKHPVVVLAALVVVMVLAWIVGAPRSAGPDEPGHQVRGGGLVRWQLDGEPFPEFDFQYAYVLPGHVGFPDPVCFAFDEFAPASCVNDLVPVDGDIPLGTRAADYPVWGHLPAGVGTLAPAAWSGWAARVADAALPIALVVTALWVASRRGALGVGGGLMAITPMAWFMFAVVNPSGLVIAGGVGLWVALTAHVRGGPDRVVGLLVACSWAAMVLPRRDGMVWASLIVAIVVLSSDIDHSRTSAPDRAGRCRDHRGVDAGDAGVGEPERHECGRRLVRGAPDAGRRVGRPDAAGIESVPLGRRPGGPTRAGLTVVGLLAGLAVMTRRDDGFDRAVLELVVGRTGGDLTEAIGILGWLDTPLPTSALFGWLVGLGVLAGAAIAAGRWRVLAAAALVLGTGVYASWVLTMLQNDETGTYWQGRYFLPLLAGIPDRPRVGGASRRRRPTDRPDRSARRTRRLERGPLRDDAPFRSRALGFAVPVGLGHVRVAACAGRRAGRPPGRVRRSALVGGTAWGQRPRCPPAIGGITCAGWSPMPDPMRFIPVSIRRRSRRDSTPSSRRATSAGPSCGRCSTTSRPR